MRIKDTSGKPSTTLTFVAVAFIAVLVKFVLAGVELPFIGSMPVMGAGEFGAAVMAIISPWVAREFKEKWNG